MNRTSAVTGTAVPFDFHDLIYQFGPNPDAVPNLWKRSFDVTAKTALLYQLDLRSATPRIKKAVRITALQDYQQQSRRILQLKNKSALSLKPRLTATVFIDGQALGPNYVRALIGKDHLVTAEDLTSLLEQVN